MTVRGEHRQPGTEPEHLSGLEPTASMRAPDVPVPSQGGRVSRERPAVVEAPLLEVLRGPQTGARFALPGGVTTVGRHPESDIVLDDTTVSRRHAEFHRTGDTVRLHDSGSLNGTYLNRAPVSQAELADGDEIWTGKFRFRFRAR